MRDKDLRHTVLLFTVSLLGLCFLVMYILARIDPQGYVYLFSPVAYIFDLYHKATPGEKLTVLYLPVGGIIGWFLKQWLSKK
jgi:hypothetical protein